MKSTRAKGDGSIIERTRAGKTYHAARITFVEGGVRKYREKWCKTPADARHELRVLRADHTRDELPSSDRTTLAGYLTGWLASIRGSISPPTYLRYHSLIETHLAPACGALRIATLESEDVLALYERMRDRGASDSTVDKAHKLLHAAVGDADQKARMMAQAERLEALLPRGSRHGALARDLLTPPSLPPDGGGRPAEDHVPRSAPFGSQRPREQSAARNAATVPGTRERQDDERCVPAPFPIAPGPRRDRADRPVSPRCGERDEEAS